MQSDSIWQKITKFFSSIPLVIWIVLGLVFGGVVGLGAYTFVYAEGYSYFSDDPAACANCHVMRDVYDGWNRSLHHANATCNDCHVPHDPFLAKYANKGLNGFNHSKAFTLNDFSSNIQITAYNREIAEENCVRCHQDLVSMVIHQDQKDPVDCLRCHVGMGHGR